MLSPTHSRRRRILLAFAALALVATASRAQLPAPPASTEDALRQMLDQAGQVFTGQVTAMRRVGNADGVTEIDFYVDDSIAGVASGSTYTLREWSGLASGNAATFFVGRHYLMFLHAPGAGGLSSPVGGPDGAIPILPGNEAASPVTPDSAGLAAQPAMATAQQAAAGATALARTPARTNFRLPPASAETASVQTAVPSASPLASSTIDLRWIATRVLAAVSYASDATTPAESRGMVAPGHLISDVVEARSSALREPVAMVSTEEAASQLPATSAKYADLLSTLRSWQREEHVAR